MKKYNNNKKKSPNVGKEILIVNNILKGVYDLLILFKPILAQMVEMEKAGLLQKGGPFKKAASLFGEISGHCKDLEGELALSEEFFKNLAN